MTERMFTFVGGVTGPWRIQQTEAVLGEPLPQALRVEVVNSLVASPPPGAIWLLRGVTSNERYVTRAERQLLVAKQPALGRPDAVHAALIPIRKSAAWWELTQDERREIFEARSEHIKTGLRYLPAVARRLHHSRDLGEPFDSSLGSSTRQNTRRRSKNSSSAYVPPRNGSTWIGRWISGLSAMWRPNGEMNLSARWNAGPRP